MDFALAPEDEAFRDELRSWLDEHLPPFLASEELADDSSLSGEKSQQRRAAWQRVLNEGRWAAVHWPEEYGGRNATAMQRIIYSEVNAEYRTPGLFNPNGLWQIGPMIIAWGTEDQKARWLPSILDATDHWCQGFSEPDAGNDLANLRTTAIRDGDRYVVNGQKIWISTAHLARWGLFLLRTDPTAIERGAKHEGITAFIIDMHTPGIEARPIRDMSGEEMFNEVFFTDVSIPVDSRLGGEGEGWMVAMGTLGHERVGIAGQISLLGADLNAMVTAARSVNPDALEDPALRERVARAWTDIELARLLSLRALSKIIKGEKNWPEVPFAKLMWSSLAQTLAALSVDLLGPAGVLARGGPDAVDRGKWTRLYSFQRYSTIGGGSSEVQKNIIADRAVKLPGHFRDSADMPVDPRAPCIIGVARRTWRDEPAPEPLDMWETLARQAATDAGAPSALGGLQSLQVVFSQSWEYDDPCGRLAERLGAEPATSAYSGLGGSVPVRLAAEAAGSMVRGELDLALIVGAEALATRRHLPDPAWSFPPDEPRPYPISIDRQERKNGIFQAYLTFALLDTARRAHLGQAIGDRREEIGRLMAPMSVIAAGQPEHAWFPIARTATEISTATPDNRMVATPYTKLMTAIMDVDMAAAVLLATESRADALGVPRDQRVYLHGTGAADEPSTMARRPEPWRSPAMAAAMHAALGPTSVDEVGHLDVYSCFASSLSFACDALGVRATDRSLTVTGGLPYHGGPGSNYSTHALAAMTEVLRHDAGSFGLVSGVGMHMTSHSASLWSTRPGGYIPSEPIAPLPTVPITTDASGPATVVTFSTVHNRQGPEWTALICELPDGSRSYARLDEPAAADEDLVGRTVTLAPTDKGATSAHL